MFKSFSLGLIFALLILSASHASPAIKLPKTSSDVIDNFFVAKYSTNAIFSSHFIGQLIVKYGTSIPHRSFDDL